MIKWQFYPKSNEAPEHLFALIQVLKEKDQKISSDKHKHQSNKVLGIIRKDLESLGYLVESSKSKEGKISVPVLFGQNGKIEKSFDADAWDKSTKTVIEVEAGRGVTNYQFLKDLFQACVMRDVDYFVVCIRNDYRKKDDFGVVINFFNTIYVSDRLRLPFKGVLVIGY